MVTMLHVMVTAKMVETPGGGRLRHS